MAMPFLMRLPTMCIPSRKTILQLVTAVAIGYAGLTLLLLAFEDRLLFHPARASDRWIEPPTSSAFQDINLRTADGTMVHGRWWPCAGSKQTVLYCHSRTGNLGLALPSTAIADWQREIGASLFIFDYPGYGRSKGSPSEAGCYAAADAAYDWLTQRQGAPSEQILIVGRSLGAAVAVDVASRKPHRALVLVSPFSSFPDVAQSHYPFLPARWLVHNRFDSVNKISKCPSPLLIVHGTRDSTAPFAQGEKLFAATCSPKRLVPVEGADHSDSVMKEFFPILRQFLMDTTSIDCDKE
jgi:alpha-beta hydrolase superfamily lysophospholipase